MRMSDWSSDVCSSDLIGAGKAVARRHRPFFEAEQIIAVLVELAKRRGARRHHLDPADPLVAVAVVAVEATFLARFGLGGGQGRRCRAKIGRASGRERVWSYV